MSDIRIGQRDRRGRRSDLVLTALGRRLQAKEVNRNFSLCGEPDLYIQWGFRLTPALLSALEHKVPFVIVDLGLFGDRETSISISFNGFHGLSLPIADLPKAPRRHPALEPIEYALDGPTYVLGQLDGDRALRGVDASAWLTTTAQALAANGEPVIVRPHPKMLHRGERNPPLKSLRGVAYRAVSWTTTAAIETARLGIPTVALHPASLAWSVSAHTTDELFLPDEPQRKAWLHRLSHMNYSGDELDEAAAYIRHGLPQAFLQSTVGSVDTVGLRP